MFPAACHLHEFLSHCCTFKFYGLCADASKGFPSTWILSEGGKRLCDELKLSVHRRLGKVLLLALFLAGVFEAVWRKSAHLEQDYINRQELH